MILSNKCAASTDPSASFREGGGGPFDIVTQLKRPSGVARQGENSIPFLVFFFANAGSVDKCEEKASREESSLSGVVGISHLGPRKGSHYDSLTSGIIYS